MAALKQHWHWFMYVVVGIRFLWFISGSFSLLEYNGRASELGMSLGSFVTLGVIGYFLSFSVPIVLYLMKKIPPYIPILAELLIICTLYGFLSPAADMGLSLFHVPVLTTGYISLGWHALWASVAVVGIVPAVFSSIAGLAYARTVDEFVNLAMLFGIGFCFQRLVVSYQKINGMYSIIQEQNQTLEVYSKQIEKLTLSEERNRLSRDLHDTVGHTFTTTIMGMDAVYYLIDSSPEEAKKNLRELLHVTRNGLDEVRKHIHQIAPEKDEQSLSLNLLQIGNEFSLHTGMKVNLETAGSEYPVSEQVRLAFIRCLQESLTNAKKHGLASQVQMELTFERKAVRLRITDNGKGADELVKGFGLQGMTDRMANLNGTLEVTSSSGKGTIIVCTVPVMQSPSIRMKQEGA